MTAQALARVRFGADPELFLAARNKVPAGTGTKKDGSPKTKNEFLPIPITGLVGGTKQAPLLLTNRLMGWEGIPNIPSNSHIQEDGAALEFNVAPAPDTRRLLRDCGKIVTAIHHFADRRGMAIYKKPSAEFSENYRQKHPEAFVIGCDPDMSAYTNEVRLPPDAVAGSLIRHAGGHFHVGYDKALVPPSVVVQFLDLLLGLPSVFMDKQGLRRQFYGQAGSFREKEYGVEYRTLSNFWLPGIHASAEYAEHLFSGVDNFMNLLITRMGDMEHVYRAMNWKEVQTAINTENEALASQLLGFVHRLNVGLVPRALDYVEFAKKHAANSQTKKQ